MQWTKENKEKIQYATALFGFVSGILMCFLAYIETGRIDGSVLGFFGICISFCCAVFGISLHYSNELQGFKEEVRQYLSGVTEEKTQS